MELKLYYCSYTDANNDNMDLFVSATNAAQALLIWDFYYEDWGKRGGYHNNVVRIDLVPQVGGTPQAHNWESISCAGSFDAATGKDLTLADIQVALDEMAAAGIVIKNDGKYSLPPEKED